MTSSSLCWKETCKCDILISEFDMAKTHAKRIHKALKHHFIPHKGNNYHPHALHPHRLYAYGGFLATMKLFVVAFALLLPFQAYLAPDVLTAQSNKLVTLTNSLRKSKGLGTLATVSPLELSAQYKATDMAQNGYFAHQGPNGHTLTYFLDKAHYQYSTAGENLAEGFSDADTLMAAWINSPTHYANLIDPNFTQFGIGVDDGTFDGTPTIFFAQHFGSPFVMDTAATQPTPIKHIAQITNTPPPAPKPVAQPVKANVTPQPKPPVIAQKPIEKPTTVAVAVPPPQPAPTPTIAPQPTQRIPQPVVTRTAKTDTQPLKNTVVELTPWQKYVRANDWFSVVPSVFSAAHWIFFAFFLFFVAVLAISIFWELHKKKPHIVGQTIGLILMIVVFWKT